MNDDDREANDLIEPIDLLDSDIKDDIHSELVEDVYSENLEPSWFRCREDVLDVESITVTSMEELEKLRGYRRITGEVTIGDRNQSFASLDELRCLREVKSLDISSFVVDMSGISGLTRIFGKEGALSIMAGFSQVPEFEHLVEVHTIDIVIGPVPTGTLKEIRGFNALSRVGELIIVNQSYSTEPAIELVSISGFNNLEEVVGNIFIDGLSSMDGESKLKSISGFESLRSAGGLGLDKLNGTRIDAFKNLETLGALGISDSSFTTEGAFERLHTIKGVFNFERNRVKSMDEFAALKSVASIGVPYISISYNPELEDIKGLFNIKEAGFDEIYITDNPKLPTCQVEKFIEHLRSLGWAGKAYIDGNDDQATCDP
ncbi:MAG: hypothetical protein GXP49_03545 [Deltaproteobacteria bacterium]|nr:hypothetical protein [Deltaproteobacteria bacterium]